MLTFLGIIGSIFPFGGLHFKGGTDFILEDFVVDEGGGGNAGFGDKDRFFGSFDGGGVTDLEDPDLSVAIGRSSFGAEAIGEHDGIKFDVAFRLVWVVICIEDIVEEALFFHATFSIILLKR